MNPAHNQSHTITEAAGILGVAAVTLRLWERQGKITSSRTAGGQRRYSEEDLDHIRNLINQPRIQSPITPPAPRLKFRVTSPQRRIIFGTLAALIISAASFVAARSGLIPSPAPLLSTLHSLLSKPRAVAIVNQIQGAVLASQTALEDLRFTANIPALFKKDVEIEGDLTAPNIIYSLTAGDNITVTAGQRPTISATDQTTALGIFKTIKVGDTTFSAGSKTDTLTFAAGSGVGLSVNTSDKKLTITNSLNLDDTGWHDDGSMVRLTQAGDLVSIGSATGAARLSIEGGSYIGDVITASSAGNLLLKLSQSGTLTLTTALPTTSGGTGLNTYTTGDLLYVSATNTLAKLPVGTSDQILAVSGGVPAWTSNPGGGGTGVFGYWQRAAGALSPSNITDDFLVGGTSTASATFWVKSSSGAVLSSGTLTLPNSNTLTGQSGNIQFSGGISVAGGTTYYVNSSGNANFNTLNAAGTTLGATTVTSFTDSGSASVSGALTLYGTPTIATTAKQTLTLGNSDTGNITFAQPITAGTWNGSTIDATYGGTGQNTWATGEILYASATNTLAKLTIGNPNQVLTVSGSNIPAWIDTTNVGNWQRIAGALSPLNITDDILVGGTATASAKFQVDSATGNITTLGTITSGLINGQTISSTANFTGTLNVTSGFTAASTASVSGILSLASSLGSQDMATLSMGNATTGNIAINPGSGLLTLAQDDDFLPATATGTSDIGSASVPWDNVYSNAIYQSGSQVCDTSGNCLGGANDLWGLAYGAYYPRYYSTVDVLIGSNATSSAKFAFMNVASGTPTASISGNIVLDSAGVISTTRNQDLTLTGGRVLLNSVPLSAPLPVSITDTSINGALRQSVVDSINDLYSIASGGTGSSGYWQLVNKVISPSNSTFDLAIGETATGSAKFQIFGLTGSATSAGNLTFSSAGTIATTANQTLNIGGTTTGTIAIANPTTVNSTSTGTELTSGSLFSMYWNPGSSTTATGNLFNINVGANALISGNIFNVQDNGSNLFSINQTGITSNLPASFTSPGDVSIAYDINFTNPTASYIKSSAPFYIQAGEIFNSSDLTLRTFNKGNVIVDSEAFVTNYAATVAGKLVVGTTTPSAGDIGNFYLTNSAVWGKALAILNQTEGQDIFTASASGVTKLTIANTGNLTTAGTITLPNSNTLTGVSGYTQFSGGISVNGATAYYINSSGNANFNTATVNSTLNVTGTTTLAGALVAQSTASVSGALTLYGTPTIATTAKQSLTLGDADTGNIILAPSGGNVGIGTTAPDAALEINHATGDSLRLTYNDSNGSATNYTDFSLDATGGLTITGSAASVASATSAEKTFLTLTPATITLTGTTQVTSLMDSYLINRATIAGDTPTVTVDDAATLTVAGPPAEGSNVSLTEAYALKINTAATTATTAYGLFVDAPTGAGSNYAAIFNTGNVGIGTSTPTALTHILTNSSTNALLAQSSSTGIAVYALSGSTGPAGKFWKTNGASSGVAFQIINEGTGNTLLIEDEASTDTTPFVIDSGGNVGIGTTAPDAKLEINHATGDSLRLTYNDSNGSAVNFTDFSLDSTGGLTLTGSAASIASATSAEKTFLTLTPATITLTGTTQVTSLMDTYQFNRTTITGDTATVTVDDAATLTIAGPPAEGSNVSLTEAYALKINTAATTATTAYGLYVDAPTGAGTNIAAIFMGGSVGVGTSTLLNEFNVAGAATVSSSLALGVQSGPPVTCDAANEGRIYYHGTAAEKKLYFCNGTTWTAIAQGSGGDTTAVISPEYPGAVISADGTNNVGTLTSDREATGAGSLYNFNYYEFSSGQSSLQDYDVYIRFKIPENFASWTTSNALIVDFETEDTTNTNNKVDATVYKDNDADTVSSATNVSNYATTWHSDQLGSATLTFTAAQLNTGITWAAGDVMIVKLKLYSKDNYFARVGSIKFDWQ